MTLRGALVIAILVELLTLLVGWYLRIRGITGLAKWGVMLTSLAIQTFIFMRYFRAAQAERRPMPRDAMLALLVVASIAITPLGGFQEKGDVIRLLGWVAYISL